MDFKVFKNAVAKRFEQLKKHQLFRVDVTKDELWDTYISSYPEGSNPVYRERTQHECNTCKQFIRSIGNVVAIVDNRIMSI